MRNSIRSSSLPRPLHVILEHRDADDFQCFLGYLQELRTDGNLPSKLNIFSDFQWLQKGCIISGSQRRELFQALSEVCGDLKKLQIDLLCDLISTEPTEELPEMIHSSSDDDESDQESTDNFSLEYHDLVQRLQVLPCSLLTTLLKNAPKLESLSLKELFLSGSTREVQELVQCLQSHPTLQSIDLRWKLPGSTPQNSVIVNQLVEASATMPHLKEVNLMIPHWCQQLTQLPESNSLHTVKLTVENMPQPEAMNHWMRLWKSHSHLKHLEVSGFHVLQDSTAEVLELLRHSRLQKLVVIDHNVFARSESTACRSSEDDANRFVNELVQVLQGNTTLQQLHLISRNPRRRGSTCSHKKKSHHREQQQQQHRALLGSMMMEHNFVLESLEVSHGGVQVSAPVLQSHHRDSPFVLARTTTMDALDLYLRLNRDGYRGQLVGSDDLSKWHRAMQYYQKDIASVFALLQTTPNLVESLHV